GTKERRRQTLKSLRHQDPKESLHVGPNRSGYSDLRAGGNNRIVQVAPGVLVQVSFVLDLVGEAFDGLPGQSGIARHIRGAEGGCEIDGEDDPITEVAL